MTVSVSSTSFFSPCVTLFVPSASPASHGDVAVGDVPLGRVGRDAGAYHDARDDGGGYAPPECAFQCSSYVSFRSVYHAMPSLRLRGSPLRCLFLWAAPSPPAARALSHPAYSAGRPSRHQGRYSSAGHSPTDWYTFCAPCEGSASRNEQWYPPRERWPQIGKPAVSGTRQARFSAFPLSQARATNPNSGGRPFFRELEVHHLPLLFQ